MRLTDRIGWRRDACEDWATLAARAAVLELPADAARALAAHVASCAHCAARAAREERLTQLLAAVPRPEWPSDRPVLPAAAAAVAAQSGGTRTAHPQWDRIVRVQLRMPYLAPIPTLAVLLLLLAIAALLSRPAHVPRRIDLVSPHGAVSPAWSVATIGAVLDPPLAGETLRLLVDDRDVTAASDVSPHFVLYTTVDPLAPGEHLVALELRDHDGTPIEERLWVVTAEPDRWAAP